MLPTVLERGSGISIVFTTSFKDYKSILLQRCPSVSVADGREMSIIQQTDLFTETFWAAWAPVVIRLSVATLSRGDDVLILGAST